MLSPGRDRRFESPFESVLTGAQPPAPNPLRDNHAATNHASVATSDSHSDKRIGRDSNPWSGDREISHAPTNSAGNSVIDWYHVAATSFAPQITMPPSASQAARLSAALGGTLPAPRTRRSYVPAIASRGAKKCQNDRQ